jgi:hypothetical protein
MRVWAVRILCLCEVHLVMFFHTYVVHTVDQKRIHVTQNPLRAAGNKIRVVFKH